MTNHAITLFIGSAFSLALEWQDADGTPVDLTGWSARLQVRADTDSTVALVDATDGDGITLDDAGHIDVELTPADTATLDAGTAVWDLVLVNPSTEPQPPLIGGTATIRRPVSR